MIAAGGIPQNPNNTNSIPYEPSTRNALAHENDNMQQLTQAEAAKKIYHQELMDQIDLKKRQKDDEKKKKIKEELEDERKWIAQKESEEKALKAAQAKAKQEAYTKELEEQVALQRKKKSDEKNKQIQEERAEEARWQKGQKELVEKDKADKQREQQKLRGIQAANMPVLPTKPTPDNSKEDALDNFRRTQTQMRPSNDLPKVDLSTEISKQYVSSQKSEESFHKPKSQSDLHNDGGLLQNQRISEMYNQQMENQIGNLKGEFGGIQKDLLSQINFLKQQTEMAIKERDFAQSELKSIQGQYNNHLLQNQIYKENMNSMLRINGQQQVNGFISQYSGNVNTQMVNDDISDILSDNKNSKGGNGNHQQQGGVMGSMMERSRSEPMKLYGRAGLADEDPYNKTASFNMANGGNCGNSGYGEGKYPSRRN